MEEFDAIINGIAVGALVGFFAHIYFQRRREAKFKAAQNFAKERYHRKPPPTNALATGPCSVDQVIPATPKPAVSTLKENDMKTTTNMLCTPAQVDALMDARVYAKGTRARRQAQAPIMQQIKRDHNLSSNRKLSLWIANPANELYRVLRDKRTGMPLVGPTRALTPGEAGYVPAKPLGVASPAPAPVAAKPAKKAVLKKAPAKKAAPVKAVKVAKVAISKASPVKTDTHQVLMRPSINGKRVMLGYASSDVHAAKLIAAARKAA